VPIREWTSKLLKRLKTDLPERERIAELKNALAERVYEIQTERAAQLTNSRAAVGAKRAIRTRGRDLTEAPRPTLLRDNSPKSAQPSA